jgi:hypothetical protein
MKNAVLHRLFLVSYYNNHNHDVLHYLVQETFANKLSLVTDAATNARFLCEQVYLCSPDVIIEEHNGKKKVWMCIWTQFCPELLKMVPLHPKHGYDTSENIL